MGIGDTVLLRTVYGIVYIPVSCVHSTRLEMYCLMELIQNRLIVLRVSMDGDAIHVLGFQLELDSHAKSKTPPCTYTVYDMIRDTIHTYVCPQIRLPDEGLIYSMVCCANQRLNRLPAHCIYFMVCCANPLMWCWTCVRPPQCPFCIPACVSSVP